MTDHLLVLSEESKKVVEVDMSGSLIQTLNLLHAGFPMTQPEGVALVRQGDAARLLIAGEQTELYQFDFSAAASSTASVGCAGSRRYL